MWDRGAALTSTLHWFETELLTREENLVGLMAVNREVLAQAELHDSADRVVPGVHDQEDENCCSTPWRRCRMPPSFGGHIGSVG